MLKKLGFCVSLDKGGNVGYSNNSILRNQTRLPRRIRCLGLIFFCDRRTILELTLVIDVTKHIPNIMMLAGDFNNPRIFHFPKKRYNEKDQGENTRHCNYHVDDAGNIGLAETCDAGTVTV